MRAPCLEDWYEALASPLGVIVKTDDPERTKAKLYALRAAANDKDLECLSIVQSPSAPDTELWLVKRKSNEKA